MLQVAKQEGEYLASVLQNGQFDQKENTFKLPEKAEPFKYAPRAAGLPAAVHCITVSQRLQELSSLCCWRV